MRRVTAMILRGAAVELALPFALFVLLFAVSSNSSNFYFPALARVLDRFDALWLRSGPGTTLDIALRTAASLDDALAKAFALATPADIAQVWVDGQPVDAEGPLDSGA